MCHPYAYFAHSNIHCLIGNRTVGYIMDESDEGGAPSVGRSVRAKGREQARTRVNEAVDYRG